MSAHPAPVARPLEEALARCITVASGLDPDFDYDPNGVSGAPGTNVKWRLFVPHAQALIAGPLAPLLAAEQERDTALEECARLREENRILRDALKPFAQFGDRFTPDTALTWSGVAHTERVFKRFNHSDFRAARSALKTGGVDA